jgi:hypothetical protein
MLDPVGPTSLLPNACQRFGHPEQKPVMYCAGGLVHLDIRRENRHAIHRF